MKLPCESAVWYTLPKIRAEITQELVKRGMKQKEVADVLGVTPAAVSQYLHKKRGGIKSQKLTDKKDIDEVVNGIMNSSKPSLIEKTICNCCMNTRK
ncbi:MAG: helix-turn-helix domain-containing protein [Candidatus Altiarchaeota archaeon]